MNLALQLSSNREKPFFNLTYRSKVWSNPKLEEQSLSCRSHLQDSFKRNEIRSEEKLKISNLALSQSTFRGLKTEIDTIDEKPYKRDATFRNPPYKLRKLFNLIDDNNGSKQTTQRSKKQQDEPKEISSYLEYLSSNSISNLEIFRNKMLLKLDKSNFEPRSSRNADREMINDSLPPEIKQLLPPDIKIPKTATLSSTDINSPHLQNYQSLKLETKPSLLNDSQLNSALKLKISNSEKSSNETLLDPLHIQKLADEIANNYRLYQENAVNNREFHHQMNSILKEEDVFEVFMGKVYKHLPLSMRIYRHLYENEEKINILRSTSLEKQKSFQFNKSRIFHKPKLIQSRYNAYLRLNQKIQELNVEFRLHGIQSLENKLLQAHEDLKIRKDNALKYITKVNKRRGNEIKSRLKEVSQFTSIYQELEPNVTNNEPDQEESSKFKREIRIVNKRLNQALKNWEQSLLQDPLDE